MCFSSACTCPAMILSRCIACRCVSGVTWDLSLGRVPPYSNHSKAHLQVLARALAHCPRNLQLLYLVPGEAVLEEHFLCVLPELGGAVADRPRCLLQLNGRPHDPPPLTRGMVVVDAVIVRLHLWGLDDLTIVLAPLERPA